jgi:hypothetical protein
MALKKDVAVWLGVIHVHTYMTAQATNRREGGLKSFRGHSRKRRALT